MMGTHYRENLRNLELLKNRQEKRRALVAMHREGSKEATEPRLGNKQYSPEELADMKERIANLHKEENRAKFVKTLIALIIVLIALSFLVPPFLDELWKSWE